MKRFADSQLLNRCLAAAALVVTDRRWAAPLCATALGFGLFVGVAIGPGAAGSMATGAQQIIEMPGLAATSGGSGDGEGGGSTALAGPVGGASAAAIPLESALPSSVPLASEPSASSAAPQAPAAEPTPSAEEEPEPAGQTFTGTVVHANPAAGSYSLAISGGEVIAVHAPKLPAAGTKLSLPLRRLANGTFAEAGDREKVGQASSASFRGTVSFADPTAAAPAYTVSSPGVSVVVHVQPDPSDGAPQLPALGSFVTVQARIERTHAAGTSAAEPSDPVPAQAEATPAVSADPAAAATPAPPTCAPDPSLTPAPPAAAVLWQQKLKVEGEPSTYLDLAGTVGALCPATGQLLLSADDARESGKGVLLAVPATIATAKLKIGDSVLATATIETDGTLTLAGLASDEHTKGADDSGSAQGDLKR